MEELKKIFSENLQELKDNGKFYYEYETEKEVEDLLQFLKNVDLDCYEDNYWIISKDFLVKKIGAELIGKEFSLKELDSKMMDYMNCNSVFDKNSEIDIFESESVSYNFTHREEFSGINVLFKDTGEYDEYRKSPIVEITGTEKI